MNTYETIVTRRAVRHFTEQSLPEEVLTRTLEAGRWAGSSKNTQPWQFIVVRARDRLDQLAECGRYASHLRGAALAVVIVTEPGSPRAVLDTGRAAQNMMLAAWADGVGSCIAGLHDEACARALLGVPEDYDIQLAISFGYPDPDAAPTIEGRPREEILASVGRRPLEEIAHWETW
jgi:nitroreductase